MNFVYLISQHLCKLAFDFANVIDPNKPGYLMKWGMGIWVSITTETSFYSSKPIDLFTVVVSVSRLIIVKWDCHRLVESCPCQVIVV